MENTKRRISLVSDVDTNLNSKDLFEAHYKIQIFISLMLQTIMCICVKKNIHNKQNIRQLNFV